MAKYDWKAIKDAYQGGKNVDKIVKEFKVTKKTLQNKISAEKWEVLGTVVEAITASVEASGKLGNLSQNFPEIAKHTNDVVQELTNFEILLQDGLIEGMKVQKEIFSARRVTTEVTTPNGIEEISRGLTPKDVNDGMNALYRAKEIKYGKEFPKQKEEESEDVNEVKRVTLARRSDRA